MSRVVVILVVIVVGVMVVGGAFYGGRVYQNHIDQTLVNAYAPRPNATPTATGGSAARATPTPPRALPAPPRCLGANDLVVDGVKGGSGMVLRGTHTYDQVCVRHGGILVMRDAMLRAGILYVDRTGWIDADGSPGYVRAATTSCPTGPTANGGPGATIVIRARAAIVRGRISADGGRGLTRPPAGAQVCGAHGSGAGGAGGSMTLQADLLVVTGTLTARGGNGGSSSAGQSGPGGAGGTIIVSVAQPVTGTLAGHVDVGGGKDGGKGAPGATGVFREITLAPAQLAALPPAQRSLVAVASPAPTLLPPQPLALFTQGMGCGAGDLTVGAGTVLHLAGPHTYRHVCVRGVLRVTRHVTLRADTILLAGGGRINADGIVRPSPNSPDNGRYSAAGVCASNHRPPHRGVPGAPGVAGQSGSAGGRGGPAGGRVTLVARRVLLAGTLSARGRHGGQGTDGAQGTASSGPLPPGGGGGGGSGGGILIVARVVQLSGTLTASGGRGGAPGADVAGVDARQGLVPRYGAVGGPGCIKLFAHTLRVASSHITSLPVPGPVVVGRRAPADPTAP